MKELDLFFQHLVAKRLSEARMMIEMASIWGEGREGQARRAALRSILTAMAQRDDQDKIVEKVGKILEAFSKKLNTVWCDDFDRAYYEVWFRFSKYVQRLESEKEP